MPSKITIKKALLRALYAAVAGGVSGFVIVPVALEDPKKYLIALSLAVLSGSLMGLQKFVSGYLKYDRKTN